MEERRYFDVGVGSHQLESLVMQAEASLQRGNTKEARAYLTSYFEKKRGPAVDQYTCRAHYAVSLLIMYESRGCRGQPLVAACLEAIKHIMKGVEAATTQARYNFLIYNGSVHHHHVTRPINREGYRQYLLPSQFALTQALDNVEGQWEWKVRQLMVLALCQIEGGKGDEASKTVARAMELCSKYDLSTIKVEVAQLQTHVSCTTAMSKAGGKPPPPPSLPKATTGKDPKKKGEAGSGEVDDAALLSAVSVVQWVQSARPEKKLAEQLLRDALAKVDPQPGGSCTKASMRVVARIGWVAATCGLWSLAESCGSRAASSQEIIPRLWSSMGMVLQRWSSEVEGVELQVHHNLLDELEELLGSFLRMNDPQGVQACAKLIWNIGLPLLQSSSRKWVKKPYVAAAEALDQIQSPLHRLRVQLHLEGAKCELVEEGGCKRAEIEIKKALDLDYVDKEPDRKLYGMERCLDRFLKPLAWSLSLRGQIPEETREAMDVAGIMVERAKEARNPSIKMDYLTRAVDEMACLPLVQPTGGDGVEGDHPLVAARKLCLLWYDIIQEAARSNLHNVVRAAAPFVLAVDWSARQDKEMFVLQGEVSLQEVQACVGILVGLELEVCPPMAPCPCEVGSNGVRLPATQEEQLNHLVAQGLRTGIELGTLSGQTWLVNNCAVTCYNTYLPLVKEQRFAELKGVLTSIMEALLAAEARAVHSDVLVMLGDCLCRAYEHHHWLTLILTPVSDEKRDEDDREDEEGEEEDDGRNEAEKGSPSYRMGEHPGYLRLGEARIKGASLVPDKVLSSEKLQQLLGDLAKVCALSEQVLKRAGDAQTQKLLESYARVQVLRGQAVSPPPGVPTAAENTSKVLSTIEMAMSTPGAAAAPPIAGKIQQDICTVMRMLSGMPTMSLELWGKLTQAAGMHGLWSEVLECTKMALRAMPVDTRCYKESQDQAPSSPKAQTAPTGKVGAPTVKEAPTPVPPISSTTLPQVPTMLGHTDWFWLGVVEVTYGQAVAAQLNTSTQDPPTQMHVRMVAMEHWMTAVRCAAKAKHSGLMRAACRHVWNMAIAFSLAPITKCIVARVLGEVTDHLNKSSSKDHQLKLLLNLYLLECLAVAGQWSSCMGVLEGALKAVPKSQHHLLVGWKAAAIGKLGVRVPEEMTRITALYPPATQAHAWKVLAQHQASLKDQGSAYEKSITVLADQPWRKVEYLLVAAEWMMCTHQLLSGKTVRDVVQMALDILREIREEELQERADMSETMSLMPNSMARMSVAGHESRRTSGAVSSVRSGAPNMRRVSQASVPTARRSITGGGSAPQSTVLSLQIKLAAKPKLPQGETEEDAGPPDEAPTRLGPRQYEQLIRANVMLSEVTSDPSERQLYLLTAQQHCVSLLTYVLKEATQPVTNFPQTNTQWGEWWPDQTLTEKLRKDLSQNGLNKFTCPAPELTIEYLGVLVDGLRSHFLCLQCLPIIQLQHLIAKVVLLSETYSNALALNLVRLLDDLGMSAASRALEERLQPMEDGFFGRSSGDEEQEMQLLLAVGKYGSRVRTPMSSGRLSLLGGMRRSTRPGSATDAPHQLSGDESNFLLKEMKSSVPTTASLKLGLSCADEKSLGEVRLLRPLSRLQVGLIYGDFLVARAQYAHGRAVLEDVLSLARAHHDHYSEARALLLLARLHWLGNCQDMAVQYLNEVMDLGGDTKLWQEVVELYMEVKTGGPTGESEGATEVLKYLQVVLDIMEEAARRNPQEAPSICRCVGQLKFWYAKALLGQYRLAINDQELGSQLLAANYYDQTLLSIREACDILSQYGPSPLYIHALVTTADILEEAIPDPRDGDPRSQILEVLEVLKEAKALAARVHEQAGYPGIGTQISLPSGRLLALVLCKEATQELKLSQAEIHYAPVDFTANVPSFPLVAGGNDEVVRRFMEESTRQAKVAADAPSPSTMALSHIQAALPLAGSLYQQAQCLGLMADVMFHMGKEEGQGEGRGPPWHCQKTIARVSPPDEVVETAEPQDVSTTHPATSQDTGQEGTEEQEAGPSDALLQPLGTYGVQAHIRETITNKYKECITANLQVSHYPDAYRCTMKVLESSDSSDSLITATWLVLAQSIKTAATLHDCFLHAAALQQPEVLWNRQQRWLQNQMPLPQVNPHYQKVVDKLADKGVSYNVTSRDLLSLLDGFPKPSMLCLPANVRVLLLHHDPQEEFLYLVGFRQNEALVEEQRGKAPQVVPGVKSAPQKSKEPPKSGEVAVGTPDAAVISPSGAACPSHVVVTRMPLSSVVLSSLRNRLRCYDKLLHQQLLEVCVGDSVAGTLSSQKTRLKKQRKTSIMGGKASKDGAKKGGSHKGRRSSSYGGDQEQSPQTMFDPEPNEQWADIVAEVERLLFPILPAMMETLPPVELPQDMVPEGPKPKSPAKGGKGPANSQSGPPLHQVVLLLDPELCFLPLESLPHIQRNCGEVTRLFSWHMMHQMMRHRDPKDPGMTGPVPAGSQSAALPAPVAHEAVDPPALDLQHLTYLVDPKFESSNEHVSAGPHSQPLIPFFKEQLLPQYGKDWQGLLGVSQLFPGPKEYQHHLGSATMMMYLGPNSMTENISTEVFMSMDLSSCTGALVLDRIVSATTGSQPAHDATKALLGGVDMLEPHVFTAALLMLRGVKGVVVNGHVTTSSIIQQLLPQLMTNLMEGKSLGASVRAAGVNGIQFELDCMKGGPEVYGLPCLVAAPYTKGKDGRSQAKNKK